MLQFGYYTYVSYLIVCLRNAKNIRNLRGRLQGIREVYNNGQFCYVYKYESRFC